MKKYRNKVALILVLALLLAAAVPALAATKTEITGAYEDVILEVKFPSAGEAVINPYKLPVKFNVDDKSAAKELKNVGQVATRPLVAANLSAMDLNIGASVVGKTKGEFAFSMIEPVSAMTNKTGMIYLQMKNAGYDLKYDTTVTPAGATTVCDGFDADGVQWVLENWKTSDYDESTDLLISGIAASKSGMVKLDAAADDGTGTGTLKPVAASYLVARMDGKIVKLPSKEWATADGFTASITWIIEPA